MRAQVGLQQLLDRVVAAADGEQRERERLSVAHATAVGRASPARGVEQRVGGVAFVARALASASGLSGGAGPYAGVA